MEQKSYTIAASTNQNLLWKNRKPLLKAVDFELTERCNNNCVHCSINAPENCLDCQKRELRTGDWLNLLEQAAQLGVLTVRFTGGEPLLREDFVEIYRYARKLGLRVLLFTNGRLISEELADLFARVPLLHDIEISVYGMKRESYEAISRSPGSYGEFKRGVDLLLERKVPFIVKGVLFPQTIDEMADFLSWSKSIPSMHDLPSFAMFLEFRHRRDSEKRNARIAQLRIKPEKAMEILAMNPELYRRETVRFCNHFFGKSQSNLFICNLDNRICIDAYGRFQFCLGLRHPETTLDSRCHTMANFLNRWMPELRRKISENPAFVERCAQCFLRSLCEQCPVKSWTEHGDLDTPVDYYCRIAHEQAVCIGLLEEGEKSWMVKDWRQRLEKLNELLNPEGI